MHNNFFQMGSNGIANEDTGESCYGQNSDYLLVPQSVIEQSGERASYFCGRSINQKEIISKYSHWNFDFKDNLS